MPALFFSNPATFMDALRNGKELFLQFVWKRSGDFVGTHDQAAGRQLTCEFVTVQNDVDVALITCPAPETVTEPFFVAAVYRRGSDTGPQDEPIARWLTLEYSLNTEKDGTAFLCEWTAQRAHLNCGPLAETTAQTFLEAVRVMVSKGDLQPLRPPDCVKRVEERRGQSGED